MAPTPGGTAATPQAALNQALGLWRAGQAAAARARLEALVARHPGFVDARITLGRILREAGEGDAALAQFRRAAEASGGHPQAWGIYVSALAESGRTARAKSAAQGAPVPAAVKKELLALAAGATPDAGPPQQALGSVAAKLRAGDTGGARAKALDLARAFPKSAAVRNLLGVIALGREDPAEAETHLAAARSLDPDNLDVAANLGLAQLRQARPMAAVRLLEPLAAPNAPLVLRVNLASACARAGLGARAVALCEALSAETPDDPDIAAIRAEALLAEDRADEAVAALQALADSDGFALQDLLARAIEAARGPEEAGAFVAGLGPLDPETDMRLAQEQAQWGNVVGATARARQLAEAHPTDPRPFRQIGLYGRWQAGDPLIGAMRAAATNEALTPSERGRFGLALGKALIDTGEDDDGFAELIRANSLLRRFVSYDPDDEASRMARIARLWDAKIIARLGRGGDDSVAPIFIIGLPRSGSTLIESVLARHGDVTALGESPVCAEIAGRLREKPSAASVREVAGEVAPFYTEKARGRARVTDKFLHNFLNAGLLAAAFPRAVFVEATRDPRATCLSIFENPLNPAGHPYAMDLAELGRYGADYTRLMDHWAVVLGLRLHRCRYEDLVADPDTAVRALLDAVGLPFEAACLQPEKQARRVDTLSVAQVRAPLHTGSTARWRRFEAHLGPLLDALEAGGAI